MHKFRMGYIQIGLLVCIQSVYATMTCGSQYSDVSSRAFQADIVFQGECVQHLAISDSPRSRQFYNVSFQMKKIFKGQLHNNNSLVVSVHSDEFCISNVSKGKTYIVFLKSLSISENKRPSEDKSYQISSFPEESSKALLKEVRNIVCGTCAKPASALIKPPSDYKIRKIGRLIKLTCLLAGNPIPVANWYKDGVALNSSRRREIKYSRRRKSSRLTLRNVTKSDSGVYECVASNVLGRASAKATLSWDVSRKRSHPTTESPSTASRSVTARSRRPTNSLEIRAGGRGGARERIVTTKSSSTRRNADVQSTTEATLAAVQPPHTIPCNASMTDYCLHNGVCWHVPHMNDFTCVCQRDYGGHRCKLRTVT